MKVRYLLFAIFLLVGYSSIQAQDAVTVPDLTGLTIPEAAAMLNATGLGLGAEEAIAVADANGVEIGKIATQSIAANTEAEAGTIVDIGVVRSPNVTLIYDDNDLTLMNTTNNVADVTGLRFVAIEGDNPASFAATRWGSNVREMWCLQVWSINATNSKFVSGCDGIQWLSTNATGEHFWTAANGVTTFSVVENGIERVQCTAAEVGSQDNPSRCSFYLDGAGAADDLTQFTYFVYTPEVIMIYNPSSDLWMPTDRTTIFNLNPAAGDAGTGFVMGDPLLFDSPEIVADITQLAPGQCIMLTTGVENPAIPQDCSIIAQGTTPAGTAFWLADFELDSATDQPAHTCPAANAEQATICIIPQ